MRNIKLICAALFFACLCQNSYSQAVLSGSIKEAGTMLPLTGATIYIPDLQTGTSTDSQGRYSLKNLPKSTLVVQVRFVGFAPVTEIIDLEKESTRDFLLSEAAIESQEVVITGSGISTDNRRSSIAIVPVGRQQLFKTPSTNIIDAIGIIPGMSQITTGLNASKPVIRGLSYNHVVTVNEGVRQEGQQWGDEHGTEIDQFSADRVEILKGPASLFYGSDAMGGVINILEPIHAPFNTIAGEFASMFATNNLMTKSTVMLEGNHNGFIWRGRTSYKNAAAYRTANEFVHNSCFNELNYSGMIGFNRKWGYTHLHYSHYGSVIGMVEELPEHSERNRTPELPFQHVNHDKISSVSNLILNHGQIRFNLGYQANRRKEFEDSSDQPSLFMDLKTGTCDIKYTLLQQKGFEFVTGISGMMQTNINKGEEVLIPEYTLRDIGGFLYAKKSLEQWTFNAGLRFDSRWVNGKTFIVQPVDSITDGDTVFPGFQSQFSSLSGSMGLTWSLHDNLNLKLNVGSGFRAPNIAELGSNGIHPGTIRYEIGNPDLKAENSLQADGELGFDLPIISASLSAYYNYIFNYIYQKNINEETKEIDGTTYNVYRFIQGNSILLGFEFEIDIHPVHYLHFENSIDFVKGTNIATGEPLPYIPALRTQHQLRWHFDLPHTSVFRQPYLSAGAKFHLHQERVDEFEKPSPGYFLLDASAGTDLQLGKQLCTLFIAGTNLTNTRYTDHLSRFKEIGVENAGWGLEFGIILPLTLWEKSIRN